MTTKTFSPIQKLAALTGKLLKPRARAITLVVMLLLMLSGGNWLLRPTQSKNSAAAPIKLQLPVLDGPIPMANSPVDMVTTSDSHKLTIGAVSRKPLSATGPDLSISLWKNLETSTSSPAPDPLDVTSQVVVNFDEPALLTHADVRDHYTDIKF